MIRSIRLILPASHSRHIIKKSGEIKIYRGVSTIKRIPDKIFNPTLSGKSHKLVSQSSINDFRRTCSTMSANNTVEYDEVKAATENPNIFIIDVREASELEATGKIPNSLNIPCHSRILLFTILESDLDYDAPPIVLVGTVESTLGLPSDEFQQKFNRPKPAKTDEIIFSCMAGKRATTAYGMAEKLGFTNSLIYFGSWIDWAKHLKA